MNRVATLFKCVLLLFLALSLTGCCCGHGFSWKDFGAGTTPADDQLLAKIGLRTDPEVAVISRESLATVRTAGYVTVVGPTDSFSAPDYDYYSLAPQAPRPAAAAPAAPSEQLISFAPATLPTPPRPVGPISVKANAQLRNSSSVIVLTGTLPGATGDTYVAGSEGTTFAMGVFTEVRGDHLAVRVLVVPIDSNPLSPVTVTLANEKPSAIGIGRYAIVTYDLRDGVAGKPHLCMGWWIPDFLPFGGADDNLCSDEDAAKWVVRTAAREKLAKGVP